MFFLTHHPVTNYKKNWRKEGDFNRGLWIIGNLKQGLIVSHDCKGLKDILVENDNAVY